MSDRETIAALQRHLADAELERLRLVEELRVLRKARETARTSQETREALRPLVLRYIAAQSSDSVTERVEAREQLLKALGETT